MKRIWILQAVVILVLIAWLLKVGATDDTDMQAPTISEVNVLVIAETWFTLEWETDEDSLGGVEWGLDQNYGNIANESGNYTKEHFINVTGLLDRTNYHFRVFAQDLSNNTGYSSDNELGTYPLSYESSDVSNTPWIITIVVIGFFVLVGHIMMIIRNKRKR